jgi:hypothetical protein
MDLKSTAILDALRGRSTRDRAQARFIANEARQVDVGEILARELGLGREVAQAAARLALQYGDCGEPSAAYMEPAFERLELLRRGPRR